MQVVPNSTSIYSWFIPQFFDSAEFDLGTVGALSTSSITRNAELLLYSATDIVNQDKGTVSFWFKPRWTAGSHDQAWLFTTSGGTDEFLLLFVADTGAFELDVRDGAGTVRAQIIQASGLVADTWHHIVFTYDVTIANGVRLYLDGAQIGSTSSNSAFNPRAVGASISIGSRVNGTFVSYGTFDDVLILKEALTASEVAGIFNLSRGLGVQRNRWTVKFADSNFQPEWLSSDIYDITLRMKEVLT